MPSYGSQGRTENPAAYYSSMFDTDTGLRHREHTHRTSKDVTSLRRPETPPHVVPLHQHSSFLIDDILGKKEREREEQRHRDREHRRERERRRSGEDEIDRRLHDGDRDDHRHVDRIQNDRSERDERDFEDVKNRENRFRDSERERYIESLRERESHYERHSHRADISPSGKSIPSPPSSSVASMLSPELPRPTPINPAAIQTSALTTHAIFKPMPTMYDPSMLSPAVYLNPHMSACQTSLMRQMCGGLGSVNAIPGFRGHEYSGLFDNQYAFSKGNFSV